MSELFDGFPPPTPGALTLYVIGPGFGEAQVVALPDGKWVVVDSCVRGNQNLPNALLEHFGARQIDLLVVTHSHVDHLRGVPELLGTFKPLRVWRWAHAGTLDDVLPRLCGLLPRNKRLQELRRVTSALADHADNHPNSVTDASMDTRPWPPASGDYALHPLSPTPAAVHQYRRAFDRLFTVERNAVSLSQAVTEFLGGGPTRLAMPGNGLSMAVSLGWKGRRIVLGGDVEKDGWSGMLDCLHEDGLEHLVREATVVKLAHHGSKGAFSAEAWKLHSSPRRVSVAVVTPFNEGQRPPPHGQVLSELSSRANRLALTANVVGAGRPIGNGWSLAAPAKPVPAKAAAVAVVIPETGPLEVYVGKGARCYARRV